MAGRERQLVALDDVRVLVCLDADAMAGAVDELLAVSGSRDDRASGRVDVLTGRAHGGRLHRRGLCCEQHVVGVTDLGRRLADGHATSDVAAVAVERSAEVAEHDLVAANDPRARVVVRARRVLTRGDDREVHLVMAFGQQPSRYLGRHLGFGAPDEGDVAGLQRGRHAVGCRAGPSQRLDLRGVLLRAKGASDLDRSA